MTSALETREMEDHIEALHNEIASLTCKLRQAREILRPFAVYAEKRDAMPLKGLGDSVHLIHASTPHQAEITMYHVRSAAKFLKALEGPNG
jgi:hypothetical protein